MTDRAPLIDHVDGYRFKPHEMPILPGSPANPDHPPTRRAAYLAIGVFMGLVGGAQNGFLLANSPALQAEFAHLFGPQERRLRVDPQGHRAHRTSSHRSGNPR